MTTFSDMVHALGGVPVLGGFPFHKDANYFFVDPANGGSSGSGRFDDPMDSIATAYAACTANQHDTVIYMAGSSGDTLTAKLTWSKDYTHLIGIDAPTMVGQRARVFAGVNGTPFITISASGCIFKNLYIFQGRDDAASLINISVTGGRNYFENVHFAGGGHASQAVDGGASLLLNGAEECTFVNCTIGVDTIAAATGMNGMLVDGDAKRCIFRGCYWTMYAGNGGARFVEIADSAAFDRYLLFDNCLFINDASATAMDSAFEIPAGMGSATHRLIVKDSYILGADDWDDDDRGLIYLAQGTITGGTNAGVMLVSAA